MGKFVVLQFLDGSFEQGFLVTLRIGEDSNPFPTERVGKLPPAPEIPQHYSRWQDIYFNLGLSLEWSPRLEAPAAQVTNYSIQDCNNAAKVLHHSLNSWLRSESFLSIREKVLANISKEDEVRVFLQAQDPLLQRLPWHLCELFENFSRAEIALIPPDTELSEQASSPRTKVNVLAIFGTSKGINTQEDRALLKQLPNTEPTFLVNPQRQRLNDHLWDQSWPIFFFAGHSSSQANGEIGRIYINETESLTIDDLKYGLKRALKNGLKLAIFNSCDGLGLARALADLHIPAVIVMREPVPDEVAQAFLRYFLQAFAQGQSLYLAVKDARERLQGLEGQYPCATWLPIICQNPAEPPLYWFNLIGRKPIANMGWFLRAGIGLLAMSSVIALSVLVIIKWFSTPTPPPQFFQTSTGEELLINAVKTPDKEAGVQAFASGDFATAITKLESSLQMKGNDPESLIYLNNARAAQKGNPFKIAVVGPIGNNLDIAQEILRGVAQAQDEFNRNGGFNRRLLQVEIGNDNNDPDIAKQLATDFVNDSSILAVVGHNASEASIAAASVYQKAGLVMISPTSGATDLSGRGSYIFRTVPTDRIDANNLADYAIATANKTKIAICTDSKSPYSESFKKEFRAAVFAQGGKVSDVDCDFSADKFNPTAVMTQFISDGADSLLLLPSVDRINQATNMAKINKGKLDLFSGSTMYTSETLKLGQADVNGMVFSVIWHPTQFPGSPFSVNAAKLWGGVVNWRTAMAYDATQVVITALKQSNTRQD
ncbi:MAG: ABC transporter substrate-binding protein, partial [Coleofasciculus sp. S288]|nr:ABC transporter substrate-binding protein [Coleofasciculus sp. S288]